MEGRLPVGLELGRVQIEVCIERDSTVGRLSVFSLS